MTNNESLEKLMKKYSDELFKYNSISKSKPMSASNSNNTIYTTSQTPTVKTNVNKDDYITKVSLSPQHNDTPNISEDISNDNEYIMEVSSTLMSETPSAPPPQAVPSQNTGNTSSPKNGKMLVQVFTARRTMPVSDAFVNVYYTSPPNKKAVDTLITNNAGKTDEIIVPAVPKELSEQPQSANPFATYNITVSHPEFADVNVEKVSVFEGITTVLDIDMMPKSVSPNGESNNYVVTEPSDL